MLRIKELLKERGMTQIDLAIALDRKKQQINDIVSGRVGVSMDMLQRIADALSVEVWQLFVAPKDIAPTSNDFVAMVKSGDKMFYASSWEELEQLAKNRGRKDM